MDPKQNRLEGKLKPQDKVHPLTAVFLGEHNTKRLIMMLDTEAGWDFGGGQPLQKESLDCLNWAARNLPFAVKHFSLFLTHEGFLSLEGEPLSNPENNVEFLFENNRVEMWGDENDFDEALAHFNITTDIKNTKT